MKHWIGIVLLLAAPVLCAAQTSDKPPVPPANADGQPRREGGRFMREGQGIAGMIGEMKPDGFTVKVRDGKTVTIKTNGQTRFIRDRQAAKFSDFKPGDFVIVEGTQSGDDTWTARVVHSRGEANMQALREGMGKQFIAGEVKSIDGTKLTIARVDGQNQTIEVDENTSFRKGRESITLPDIKVGDRVFGRGALNAAGVFVPTTLNVGGPGGMGMGMGSAGARGRMSPETKSAEPPSDLQTEPAPPK